MSEEYVDLGEQLPPYECSKCGWLHSDNEAWGFEKPTDRLTCPECGVLAFSKEVRDPDHSQGFTGFSKRRVRS